MINLPQHISSLSLDSFHLLRPEKIRWLLQSYPDDPIDCIRSKSLRKFLTTADQVLSQHGIVWEHHVLTEQQYLDWLPYYKQKMIEQNYSVVAREQWYQERTSQGKQIEGCFFYQQMQGVKTRVGSGIFLVDPGQKATFAFKASDRIDLTYHSNSSLGAVIDFFFLREMIGRKMPIISAGRSGNAFGVFETLGFPIYKLRFGYEPHIAELSSKRNSIPINDEGVGMCYALNEKEQLGLYFFQPVGSTYALEHQRYATTDHPLYQIEYDRSQLGSYHEEQS